MVNDELRLQHILAKKGAKERNKATKKDGVKTDVSRSEFLALRKRFDVSDELWAGYINEPGFVKFRKGKKDADWAFEYLTKRISDDETAAHCHDRSEILRSQHFGELKADSAEWKHLAKGHKFNMFLTGDLSTADMANFMKSKLLKFKRQLNV